MEGTRKEGEEKQEIEEGKGKEQEKNAKTNKEETKKEKDLFIWLKENKKKGGANGRQNSS